MRGWFANLCCCLAIEIIKVKVDAQIKFLTDSEKAFGCHTGSMGF
jgi:hypothetical protein